ncbi:hypothetical protein BASA81_003170 [Batrachochytrium salamandrivorans]|nr:hypothetical protein BASA81_003170 [Batrachochytrium salamandrivorans]
MTSCFSVYLLTPRTTEGFLCKSYVGFTTNLSRRLRQHNREIKGGAKKTSRHEDWEFVCHVTGFPSQTAALQFEWMWQHPLQSKLSRQVVRAEMVGRKGVGRSGSVKRKLGELVWLLGLEERSSVLEVKLNLGLFHTAEAISLEEFWDKLGISEDKMVWPLNVLVSCTGGEQPAEVVNLVSPDSKKKI